MTVLLLDERELRACAACDTASLACIRAAFGWLHEQRAVMPPVAHLSIEGAAGEPCGDVDIKTAAVRGLARFAVKIAAGFPGNRARDLPSGSGMMVLLSSTTGYCTAVLLDNGYLTDLRTGLAGAVAAECLAPPHPSCVGIVGCGVQARFQADALRLVRDFDRLLIWGRSPQRRDACVRDLAARGLPAAPADSVEALARTADLIITTTASREPLLRAEWLHPGQHITAVGADFPGKRELGPGVLQRADRLYCDSLAQCRRLGELQHLAESEPAVVTELGAVVCGAADARRSADEITICDLTGVGVQDTAIAERAYGEALARGLGTPVA